MSTGNGFLVSLLRRHRLALLLGLALAATGTATGRELTFAERVRAQEAIERVYHSHRINASAVFDEAVPRQVLRRKVEDYLHKSSALERQWNRPVTAEALRRELQRIARKTQFSDRLEQIYQALDRDPVLIQECFVRPVLVDRLVRNLYAFDGRIHAAARREMTEIAERLHTGHLDPESRHPRRTPAADTGGALGVVRDERDKYVLLVALPDGERALYSVPKKSWDDWWSETRQKFAPFEVPTVASIVSLYPAAEAAGLACQPDHTWNPLDNFPDSRWGHMAVWTGTEMIIFGGTGARYDPLLDVWAHISDVGGTTSYGPGVWTGTEVLVWGQGFLLGGRYDPASDTWQPISSLEAPVQSPGLSVVWTGTEMIVWGGTGGETGRYDPAADTWAPMSSTGAPSARTDHTAVWTGTEMIVWGGTDTGSASPLDDGGRYNPATDSWSPMSTSGLTASWQDHHAVWTGSEMLIWSGLQHGARYDPVSDVWSPPISLVNAPSPRSKESVVWTGSELLVWGGRDPGSSDNLGDGGRYDPQADQWTPLSTSGSPTPREGHSFIWTGSEVIVWGGRVYLNNSVDTGGRYDPVVDQWLPTAQSPAPEGRSHHGAAWTGNVMVIWGGRDLSGFLTSGGRYDPLTDAWTPTTLAGAPNLLKDPWTFWTGRYVLFYSDTSESNDGGRYDPVADAWLPVTPMPGFSRFMAVKPKAAWTGTRMAVMGLRDPDAEDVAGFYDPESDSWEEIPLDGGPFNNFPVRATLIAAGSRLIHFGGSNGSQTADPGTGHIYDPATRVWSLISQENAADPRVDHDAYWTGTHMLIWGGENHGDSLISGGLYDPILDSWTSMSTQGGPPTTSRFGQDTTGIWTGRYMLIWGDASSGAPRGIYDPALDTWTSFNLDGAPPSRNGHTLVWTDREMIPWGGSYSRIGGRYALGQQDDFDGDGLTICAGDCDDLNPLSFPGATEFCDGQDNNCDGVIPGIELIDLDLDAAPACNDCDDSDGTRFPGNPELCNGNDDDCNGVVDDADQDGDGYLCAEDCQRFDLTVFPGAPEILDGQDNQCPGDVGHGAIDEISGAAGFTDPGDPSLFCWPAQQGAGLYLVARSSEAGFPAPCTLETVTSNCIDDPAQPGLGEIYFYLVRPLRPFLGSWGTATSQERTVTCGAESGCSNGLDDDGNGAIDCEDAGCYGGPNCTSARYSFIDTFADDVATTSLFDFFSAAQALQDDYLHFSVGGGPIPVFEWCSERADFYRDQYVALAAGGGSVFSGTWNRWVQTDGAGWSGALTDPHENLYGSACELEYYWCAEVDLDGHFAGVGPVESGICEAFDGLGCGDGTMALSITVGRDRQAACGF